MDRRTKKLIVLASASAAIGYIGYKTIQHFNSKIMENHTYPFEDMTDKEKIAWMMKEYEELQVVNEDNITFTGKTASMIAYERMLESERPEGKRLFNDHLAKHFVGPYGKRVSEMLAVGLSTLFDPNKDIGFKYNGHVNYTAARTQLVNDYMNKWIGNTSVVAKQVVELGAGLTTRAFWVEALKEVDTFIEVDTKPVNDAKNKILDDLKAKGELTDSLCPRQVISLDFTKESVKDLPSHGFNNEAATCWILEGLVMYLTIDQVASLLRELSDLSPAGSYIILNFITNNPASDPDVMEKLLEECGWQKDARLFFGDEGFNYGKYPMGKPASELFGFSMYSKN